MYKKNINRILMGIIPIVVILTIIVYKENTDQIMTYVRNFQKNTNQVIIYKCNWEEDGLYESTVIIKELTPESLIKALMRKKQIPKDVKLLDFKQEGKELTLDLSDEYRIYAGSLGTSGEYCAVGSLVNTFLDAYDAETIKILVEGKEWGSGHIEYKDPLTRRYSD